MPRTRGRANNPPVQNEDVPAAPPTGPAQARANARARSRPRPLGQEELVARQESLLNFEPEDVGKTLAVREGRMGFIGNTGFDRATNFIMQIGSQVYSLRYAIKGEKIFFLFLLLASIG